MYHDACAGYSGLCRAGGRPSAAALQAACDAAAGRDCAVCRLPGATVPCAGAGAAAGGCGAHFHFPCARVAAAFGGDGGGVLFAEDPALGLACPAHRGLILAADAGEAHFAGLWREGYGGWGGELRAEALDECGAAPWVRQLPRYYAALARRPAVAAVLARAARAGVAAPLPPLRAPAPPGPPTAARVRGVLARLAASASLSAAGAVADAAAFEALRAVVAERKAQDARDALAKYGATLATDRRESLHDRHLRPPPERPAARGVSPAGSAGTQQRGSGGQRSGGSMQKRLAAAAVAAAEKAAAAAAKRGATTNRRQLEPAPKPPAASAGSKRPRSSSRGPPAAPLAPAACAAPGGGGRASKAPRLDAGVSGSGAASHSTHTHVDASMGAGAGAGAAAAAAAGRDCVMLLPDEALMTDAEWDASVTTAVAAPAPAWTKPSLFEGDISGPWGPCCEPVQQQEEQQQQQQQREQRSPEQPEQQELQPRSPEQQERRLPEQQEEERSPEQQEEHQPLQQEEARQTQQQDQQEQGEQQRSPEHQEQQEQPEEQRADEQVQQEPEQQQLQEQQHEQSADGPQQSADEQAPMQLPERPPPESPPQPHQPDRPPQPAAPTPADAAKLRKRHKPAPFWARKAVAGGGAGGVKPFAQRQAGGKPAKPAKPGLAALGAAGGVVKPGHLRVGAAAGPAGKARKASSSATGGSIRAAKPAAATQAAALQQGPQRDPDSEEVDAAALPAIPPTHWHACVEELPPLRPGELRALGHTFHPPLARVCREVRLFVWGMAGLLLRFRRVPFDEIINQPPARCSPRTASLTYLPPRTATGRITPPPQAHRIWESNREDLPITQRADPRRRVSLVCAADDRLLARKGPGRKGEACKAAAARKAEAVRVLQEHQVAEDALLDAVLVFIGGREVGLGPSRVRLRRLWEGTGRLAPFVSRRDLLFSSPSPTNQSIHSPPTHTHTSPALPPPPTSSRCPTPPAATWRPSASLSLTHRPACVGRSRCAWRCRRGAARWRG